jgi:hypothetical protein
MLVGKIGNAIIKSVIIVEYTWQYNNFYNYLDLISVMLVSVLLKMQIWIIIQYLIDAHPHNYCAGMTPREDSKSSVFGKGLFFLLQSALM